MRTVSTPRRSVGDSCALHEGRGAEWHVSTAVTNWHRYAFHINSSLALFFFPKGRVSQIVELNSELCYGGRI